MILQRLSIVMNSISSIQARGMKTSPALSLIQKWRKERGLPLNPNATGVLLNGPDYSFKDGRMTPYGVRQRNRMLREQEVRDQIISLTGEIDFAVERHDRLLREKEERRNEIIGAKLKPKGLNLLKSK